MNQYTTSGWAGDAALGFVKSPITWLLMSCTVTAIAILSLLPLLLWLPNDQDYNWGKRKRRDLLLSQIPGSDKVPLSDTKKDDIPGVTTQDDDYSDTHTVVSAHMLQSLFHRLVVQDKWKEASLVADHVYNLVRAKLLLTNLGVDGLRLLEDVIRGYPPGVENHVMAIFSTLADIILGRYPGSVVGPSSSRDILARWSMQVMTSLITHASTVSRSDIVRLLAKRYFEDQIPPIQVWTFKSLSVFLLHCLKTRHVLRGPETESIHSLLREGLNSRHRLVQKASQDCLTHYTRVDQEAGERLRYQIGANI